MLDHMSLRVSDPRRAAVFYDAALAPLGCARVMEFTDEASGFESVGYGPSEGKPYFWIGGRADDLAPVGAGPGFHVAFAAASRDAVDSFYNAALKAGGTDNGPPGLRLHYHADYYAAFVIDPDGYHVEAVCHKPH